mgnify:CR=1 FL=1
MRALLLLSSAVFVGCATWFPAAVNEIEEGVYTLTTTGNSFASSEKMAQKLNRKADALCGEAGYTIREDANTTWGEQKDCSTGMTTNYQQMSMTIECKK